jgi:hypothetical protein
VVFGDTGAYVADGTIGAGDNHSWIVLKSPDNFPSSGQNMWMTIDAGNHDESTNAGRCEIHVSSVAPGTDGALNKRPSLTPNKTHSWHSHTLQHGGLYNEKSVAYTSTSYYMRDGLYFDPGYDASHVSYFNGGRASNGSFFFFCTREGYGFPPGGGFLVTTDSVRAAGTDPWNVIGSFGNYNVSPGFFNNSATSAYSTSNGTPIFSIGNSSTDKGHDHLRTWNTSGINAGYDDTFTQTYVMTLAAINGYWDEYQAVGGSNIDSKWDAVPFWVVGTEQANGTEGVRGRIQDLKAGPSGASVAQGTHEPSSGTAQSAYFGNWWFPVGATVIF